MPRNTAAEVLIVHCVDTEGPLYEPLDVTFERLRELFGIEIAPTQANLAALREKQIPLGGQEDAVAETLNGHRLNYNDTWTKIDAMLERMAEPEFRNALLDDFGEGWVVSWHCLDLVGIQTNPRRRSLGHHVIFDHYRSYLQQHPHLRDSIQWHFHPLSTYREGHRCATHYLRNDEIYQVLCRKLIERAWFPTAFRAGFQAERPDVHWFLEQFIPFDISSMAVEDPTTLEAFIDFRNGRSGDWRGAPTDWSAYHPDHDDLRREGSCRRWIGRALNVMNRIGTLDQPEVDKAFARARSGQPALLGISGHDYRDLTEEVTEIQRMLKDAKRRFPDVAIRYCDTVDAFRRMIDASGEEAQRTDKLRLSIHFHPASPNDVPFIEVEAVDGKVFGPQPFLAIQTAGQQFIHDNFDISPCGRKWFYAFHGDTLPVEDVARIAVGANDRFGNVQIIRMQQDRLKARLV